MYTFFELLHKKEKKIATGKKKKVQQTILVNNQIDNNLIDNNQINNIRCCIIHNYSTFDVMAASNTSI